MIRTPWIRLLLAVASLQVLGALTAIASGRVAALPLFTDLPHSPAFYAIPMLAFALGGWLLLSLGRDDSRAVSLGEFFFLLACPFTNRWLLGLVHIAPPAAGWPVLLLRSLQVDAFFPYFFWRFTREFPESAPSPRLRRSAAAGERVALAAGGALFLSQLGLFLRQLTHLEGAGPLAAALPKPSYGYYGPLGLLLAAAFPFLWLRARAATGKERQRAVLFAAALTLGTAPLFSQIVLGLLIPPYKLFIEQPAHLRIVSAVIFGCFLSIPFTTAYAVLVHHILTVRLIARRALQYALARFSALTVATVPVLALLAYLYQHREERISQLFSGNRMLLLLTAAAVGAATLRYRRSLLDAVDRRFFREQYDARLILTLLVERIRATSDVTSLASLVAREIDLALHLEGISLLVLDLRSGMLNDPRRRTPKLDASSPLALLAAGSSDPLATDLEDPRSLLARLPEKDRHWMVDSGFKLIVPILARDGSLLGLIGLGQKKSGLPFLKEDRQLLHAIASSSAWVLELAQTHSTGHSAGPRGTRDPAGPDDTEAAPPADLAKECTSCGTLYPSYTVFCAQCSRRLEMSHVPYVLPGKFRFEKRIGSGGMGVVYRGADLALGRPVAVKTLRRVSPEDAMRLRREARTAAAVSHRHLAPVYGLETWEGTPMLVLELLEGGTLSHRIEKGRMEPLEMVELGIAMADALAQLHASDILHRDIKPSNIGFTRDGVPKLMDFGIARATFDLRRDRVLGPLEGGDDDSLLPVTAAWNQSPTSVTLTQQLVGTLSYLSPEAINGETPTATFDLWSLSIVLYECLLGRKIFSGGDAKQLMARIRLGRVPEFAQVLPEADEALADFFRSALHRTVSRRPASAVDMRQRLEAVRARLRPAV